MVQIGLQEGIYQWGRAESFMVMPNSFVKVCVVRRWPIAAVLGDPPGYPQPGRGLAPAAASVLAWFTGGVVTGVGTGLGTPAPLGGP